MIIQPNKFRTCHDCGCEVPCIPPYLAKQNDYFSAEVQNIDSFLTVDKIVNGTFDTVLAPWTQTTTANIDWAVVTAKASVTLAGSTTSERLSQTVAFNHCKIYFDHSALAAGVTLTVKGKTGGSYVNLLVLTGAISAATGVEILLSGTDYTDIAFVAARGAGEGNETVTIDNVKLYELEATYFTVTDCCTDAAIDTLDVADITLFEEYAEIKFRFSKYTTSGQVKLCYNQQLITNGTFNTDVTGWTQSNQPGQSSGNGWTYNAGVAETSFVISASKMMVQNLYLEKCQYIITFDLISAIDAVGGSFTIFTDDLSLNETITIDFLGTQPQSFTFTPEFTGYQNLTFYGNCSAVDPTHILGIDNISIISKMCSPCYEIADMDCTLLIEATNNQASYGLGATFFGSMRIAGKMHKILNEITSNVYRNSIGTFSNPMTNFAFIYELETYQLHIDQILALILLLKFDNLMINKQYYVLKEGNVEVDYMDFREFGKFKVELYPREQWLEKVT